MARILTASAHLLGVGIVSTFTSLVSRERGSIQNYLITILLSALALWVRLAIAPVSAGLQYITFFPAVTLSAIVGGYRAGLLATAIGLAFATWIFIPPYYGFSIEVLHTSLWSNLVFLGDGVIVSFAIEALNQYRRRYARELKQSTEAHVVLEGNTRHLKSILDNLFAYVALLDTKGVVLEVNQAPLVRGGYSREDVIGQYFYDAPWWSYDAAVRSQLIEAITAAGQGQMRRYEVAVKMGNDLVPIDFQISPVFDDVGIIVGLLPTAVDITERQAAELAITESRNLLRTIIDSVPLRIFWKDKDSRFLGCNPRFANDAGKASPDELIGQDDHHMAWAKEADIYRADDRSVMESGAPKLAYKEPQTTPDGRDIWLSTSKVPLRNQDNEIIGVLGIYDDITREVTAREELRLRKEYFQRMFDDAPIGIAIADLDGRYLAANAAMCRMIGYGEEELKRMTYRDITHPDDIDENDRQRDMLLHGDNDSFQMEKRYICKDGSIVWVLMVVSTIRGPDGKALVSIGQMLDIGRIKRTEQDLLAARHQLEATLQAIPDLMFKLGLDGRYYEVYASNKELLAAPAEYLIGKTVADVLPPDAAEVVMSALQEAHVSGRSHGRQYQLFLDHRNLWFELSVARKPATSGNENRFIVLSRDITERKRAEEEMRIASAAFESKEPMIITDANSVILRVNRAFIDSTGYTAEEAVGRKPNLLKSGRHDANFFMAMWDSLIQTGRWQGEIWDRRKNGDIYPKWLTISVVKGTDGKVTHYIGTHVDISERKETEQRIENLAFFDQLTGVANRTLLLDRLKQAIAVSSRSGSYGALLFIDLDNFKTLNDTLGHALGDLLLKQVAKRLAYCVREGDTVARVGGDEFVVVLAGLGADKREAAASTEIVAEKSLACLNQAYSLGGVVHHSTASIGIALFGTDPVTIDDLMMQADLAMYKSKEAGRNTWHFFDPHMESAIKERAALESDLLRAIEQKQFLLHYQAQVVHGGRVTGAEVLVRWQHPQRGLVPPNEFIPLAEETGAILPLGQWVLETACAQLAKWAAQPTMSHLTIAVNVSARQFRQAGFVDQVQATLKATGANPQRLKIELTESMLVENVEDIISKMFALKASGVGFSMDDFGTGYSSLSYLKRMPLDQLKIDQSFVRDILIDQNDVAIARTIVTLAQSMGLAVIAEGVEMEIQRDYLESIGCHAYQGYFFSRPLPLAGFDEYVRKSNESDRKLSGADFVI